MRGPVDEESGAVPKTQWGAAESDSDAAIAKLKEWLPDPARRIQVQDLIAAEAAIIDAYVRNQPLAVPNLDTAELQRRTEDLLEDTEPLLRLVALASITTGTNFTRTRGSPRFSFC